MKKIEVLLIATLITFAISCKNNNKEKTAAAPADTASTTSRNPTPEVAQPSARDREVNASSNDAETTTGNDYQYDPSESIITGTINTQMFYGAPGYGENPRTDKKEYPYVIILDKPINVIAPANADPNDGPETKRNVKMIQLIYPGDMDMNYFMRKKVKLTGTFFAPETGHHHTDVMMNVTFIEQ